jgi:hypothetical protein
LVEVAPEDAEDAGAFVAVGAAPTWDVGLVLFDDELLQAAKPPASSSNAAMAPACAYRERLRLRNETGINPP